MSIFPDLANLIFPRDQLSRWRRLVSRIDALERQLESLTDQEIRKKSLSLRYQVLSGKSLDELLVEAYALVREAGRRTIGMRHYDVQLLGGIAMHFQNIIVMQTGEGKTLTATLPLYLNALAGQGVHLATANDYLAQRDAETMSPIYELLGLSVGTVGSESRPHERLSGYAADITYTTAKEIGFDFLRDRLQKRSQETGGSQLIEAMIAGQPEQAAGQCVQRQHHFVLVDEADSILIDEARTPLIVSALPDAIAKAKTALYNWCAENCHRFENLTHYELLPNTKQLHLTAEGRRLVRKLGKPELLNQTPILDIYEQLELSVYVDRNYIRDRHYIVRDDEIVIVDEFTGRLAEGRKWRAGIHQAIEAREKIEVSVETGESARITIQDLFLRYDRLAGMTGTVGNSTRELKKIYNAGVVVIPTHRPSRRKRWDAAPNSSSSSDRAWTRPACAPVSTHACSTSVWPLQTAKHGPSCAIRSRCSRWTVPRELAAAAANDQRARRPGWCSSQQPLRRALRDLRFAAGGVRGPRPRIPTRAQRGMDLHPGRDRVRCCGPFSGLAQTPIADCGGVALAGDRRPSRIPRNRDGVAASSPRWAPRRARRGTLESRRARGPRRTR